MLVRPAAAALLLAGLLAGCGAEAEPPEALPTLPAPTTAAATPSPTPSPVGEQAAVEAAVRAYFEGFNEALDARDPELLAKNMTADCGCRSVVEDLRGALAKGEVQGNRYTVRSVQVRGVKDVIGTASAVVDSTAGRIVAGGRTVSELTAQDAVRKELVLRKEVAGWLVFSVADA